MCVYVTYIAYTCIGVNAYYGVNYGCQISTIICGHYLVLTVCESHDRHTLPLNVLVSYIGADTVDIKLAHYLILPTFCTSQSYVLRILFGVSITFFFHSSLPHGRSMLSFFLVICFLGYRTQRVKWDHIAETSLSVCHHL